jgi:hypothetical protein
MIERMDSLIFEWNRLFARRQALVVGSPLLDVERMGQPGRVTSACSTDAGARVTVPDRRRNSVP